jgi:DNA-binding NarL/FixJ family response regulator
MAKIRVLIADDHAVLREGMRHLLEQERDLEIVGEAGDGEEAVKLASELKPDVVLMDIVMPKLSGVEATKLIKQTSPSTNILILTAYSDIRYILGLLEAGACGYLLKSAHSDEIVGAIRAVEAHLTNIFNKMRVGSRTDAIIQGLREGYITLDDIPPEGEKGFKLPSRAEDLASIGKLGIIGMHERAHLAGGTLRIYSKPGKGTQVIAELPLPK